MDIPNLLKTLLPNINADALAPVFDLLRKNSFDLNKTVRSLTPETLAPLIRDVLKNASPTPPEFHERANGVAPIADVADKEIVYLLNRYVSAETD